MHIYEIKTTNTSAVTHNFNRAVSAYGGALQNINLIKNTQSIPIFINSLQNNQDLTVSGSTQNYKNIFWYITGITTHTTLYVRRSDQTSFINFTVNETTPQYNDTPANTQRRVIACKDSTSFIFAGLTATTLAELLIFEVRNYNNFKYHNDIYYIGIRWARWNILSPVEIGTSHTAYVFHTNTSFYSIDSFIDSTAIFSGGRGSGGRQRLINGSLSLNNYFNQDDIILIPYSTSDGIIHNYFLPVTKNKQEILQEIYINGIKYRIILPYLLAVKETKFYKDYTI